MIHGHAQHRDAGDERVRLANVAKHENEVRRLERERERRRVLAMLTEPEPVLDPTGFGDGCVI